MKRIVLGLLLCVACGGRTTLDDSDLDASAVQDGGVIQKDGGPIQNDSGPIQVDASPPPLDGGPPPPPDAGQPPAPITCGNTTCNAQTQVCCVTFNGQTTNETCTPQGQCNGAALACTEAANCPPNEVCCATLTQTQQSSACQAQQCQGGFQHPQLCGTNAECPQGTTCKASPFGVKICRP